jgi:hypothetical protein
MLAEDFLFYFFILRPNYEMISISLHEAVPGHHLQVNIGLLLLLLKTKDVTSRYARPFYIP